MNYDVIVDKILNDKKNSDILHMIIRIYSIYFQKKAMSLFGKDNIIFDCCEKSEDFLILKDLLKNKFLEESWDKISDLDIFNNIVLKINKTKELRA